MLFRSVKKFITGLNDTVGRSVVILLEEGVGHADMNAILWQVTGNTDPVRDISAGSAFVIDAGFKLPDRDGFNREWPNVVVADMDTILKVDDRWADLTGMEFIPSPSTSYTGLVSGKGASASLPDKV